VLLALVLTPLLASPAAAGEVSRTGKPDLSLTTDATGVVLDLSLPPYRIVTIAHEGVTYQQIEIDGEGWWPGGQPGAPSLPERGLMLAVPPTGEVTVQVLEAQPQPVDGVSLGDGSQAPLAPKPTGVLVEDEAGEQVVEQWLVDPAAYSLERWTPASQAEITEEGWFRGYRFVRLSLRPFQFDPANGQLKVAPAIRVRVSFSEPAPTASAPADPLFARIFQATFANYDQAAGWQTRPEPQDMPADAAQRLLTTDPWVKVTVNTDGLYRVTYADLQGAGVSTAALNSLNPRTFRLLDAGQEQHIHVVGEGDNVFNTTDSIVFYGLRNTHPHSDDNNVYWLTWGRANGLRMAVQNAAPSGAPLAATLLTTAHAEENLAYKQQRPWVDWLQPVLYDHWYSGLVSTSKVVSFPGLKVDTASSVAPVLSVWLAGDIQQPTSYTIRFILNGGPLQSKTWSNARVLDGTVNLPAGLLVDGDNTVEVRPLTTAHAAWLDWLRLTYPYSGQFLSGATFNNPTSGPWRYQITGAPSATPWVLNVGQPGQPKLLSNVAASGSGPYTLAWQQTTTAADRYLVAPEAEVRQPATVAAWQGSTLLDANQQVDYLMITHPSLIGAIQPLAAMHGANGLSVRVVDVQQIYDLFSDGSQSADAIRNYLAYAYSSYQAPAPTYVLLVGDGSVNSRSYPLAGVTLRANLIPPFYGGFDAWGGASISDNGFVRVQGNDLLGEMIVSRLPVNDASQTSTVVNKILSYPSTFPQNRALSTLWIADNPDNDNPVYGTQFHMATEETLAPLQPQFQVDRVYLCVPPPAGPNNCPSDPWIYTNAIDARAAVVNKWNQGHLLLHFTGHGSYTTWAHEHLFRVYWIDQLSNATALPFLLVSSCTNGYFASEQWDGIDEGLLRAGGRGTIGGFAGVTFDTLPPQTHLLTDFMEAVMHDGITQPGAAATVARARTYGALPYPENERTAVGHGLTGDPAMALIEPDACAHGDINCSGLIDVVDVQLVAGAWNSVAWTPGYNPRADLVRDGHIDINDIMAVVNLWQTPVP
jgi:hypothetical protein